MKTVGIYIDQYWGPWDHNNVREGMGGYDVTYFRAGKLKQIQFNININPYLLDKDFFCISPKILVSLSQNEILWKI